jgi:hypothetical protein
LSGISELGFSALILLRHFFYARGRGALAAALFAVLAGSFVGASGGRAADTGMLHLSCVNLVGGARISIVIDLDRALADSQPAKLSDKWITWHDPQRGYLDLERASGRLDIRNASSTGGYFLHYQCQPE